MISCPGLKNAKIGSENPKIFGVMGRLIKKFISRECGEGGVLKNSVSYENYVKGIHFANHVMNKKCCFN